jgi:hypothetical protein
MSPGFAETAELQWALLYPIRATPSEDFFVTIHRFTVFETGTVAQEILRYTGGLRARRCPEVPKKRCRSPCTGGVSIRARLHRKREDRQGNPEARKREKPRQKRRFSHRSASVCIDLQSGGGGIRTRERLTTSLVFKTSAIGRSATPPWLHTLLY